MKKFLILIAIVFSGITSSYASHAMGGDITYTYISGNNYEVTLTLYRDCGGATLSQFSAPVSFNSSCGNQNNVPLAFVASLPGFPNPEEVSQVCATALTTCGGGPNPGTQRYIYRGIVTLVPCANWTISWSLCCRNGAITNLATTPSLYLETTLNNVIGAFNNSPQYSTVPTPYLCVGQLKIFNHGATDVDGDSLYYSFNNPLTNGAAPIGFAAGYSLLQPMITTAGMNLNQTTGEMCFTPSQAQVSVVSVLISEYRNGALIGTQIREMQVVVVACFPVNSPPTVGVMATCGGSGGMTIPFFGPSVDSVDQNSIRMCPNDSVCLQIVTSDPDTNAVGVPNNIFVTSNVLAGLPGATFTVANDSTPSPTITICWSPTALDTGLNTFTVTLLDDACPISGVQNFTFNITVFDQPYAGLDDTICESEPIQLSASGGATYTWFDVATNIQIPVGPAFSCNPCFNPIATPLVTTNYYVLSSLTAACENTDSVIITVIPGYTLSSSQSAINVCVGDTVNFLTTPSIPGAYIYDWTAAFGTILGTPTDSMTVGTFNSPGTEIISLMVSTASCALVDTFFVNVSPQPVINITTLDTLLNCVDTVAINVDLGAAPVPNNYSFNWSFPTTLDDSTAQNPNAIPTQGITDYVVIVTDTIGGCFDTDTLEVRSCCIDTTITFENSSCFGADDGSITVSATALNSDFVIEFYSNNPVFTLLQTSLGNPADSIINNLAPGSYTVMIFDTIGCSLSDTFLITEPSPVTISNVSPDTSICVDGTANLYATANGINGPFSLIWNNGAIPGNGPHNIIPWTDSTFTVFAQDANGCVSPDSTIIVTLRDSITINNIELTDTTICDGESTIIVVDATGGGAGLIYTWYNGNNTIIGATDTGAFLITPSYDGEIFTVIVSDSCTTPSVTDSITSDWSDVILPTYTISDSAGCYIDLAFTPVFTNTTPNLSLSDSSTWDFGNGTTYSWPFAIPFDYHYDDPGIYDVTLTVTDEFGCNWDTIMEGIQVYAYDQPQADFLWNPNPTDYLNAQITFNNQSTDNFFNQWLFITDVQFTSTDTNPVFQFPQDRPGSYNVTLITTTEHGCIDSVTKVVVIDDVFLFYIPTAFTPDGDGLNDNFKVVGEGLDLSNFKMTIFNKWGELIFESNNPDIGWNGTQNGSLVPTGVYIWKIDAKEAHSPIIHNKDGFITVVK